MFYMPKFWYKTHAKSLPEAPDIQRVVEIQDCVIVLDKLLKNAKWLAGKFETRNIVLHFFSHLSESRADPEYARELLENAAGRLDQSGYVPHLTPFGYFCEMKMHIGGESLAKVFKSF